MTGAAALGAHKAPLALEFISVFILCSVFLLIPYLWRRYRLKSGSMPLGAGVFLLLVFVSSILIGSFSVMLGLRHVPLAMGWGLGCALSLLHPVAAVSFFVVNLLLRAWEYLPDNQLMRIMTRFLASVTILSWLIWAVRQRSLRLRWSRPCTIYVALIAWLFVCSAVNDLGANLAELFSSFFPVSVLGLLVMNVLDDERDLDLFVVSISLAVTGVIATALYETIVSPLSANGLVRLFGSGQLGNSNDLGALIALNLPFLVAAGRGRKGVLGKLGSLFAIVIMLWGLWISQSRGAMLAIGAGSVAYLFTGAKAHAKILVLAFLLLCAPVVLYKGLNRAEDDTESSRISRWNYVVTAFYMLKDHPVFGVGFNNYPRLFEKYTREWLEGGERTAHSSWVLVFAEAGPIGLLLFCMLFLYALGPAWKMRGRSPEFFLGLVSYGTTMSLLSHTYLFLPYLLFALILAAGRIYLTKAIQPEPSRVPGRRVPVTG